MRILLIVFVGIFAYSAFNIFEIYSAKNKIEKETQNYKQYAEDSSKNVLNPDWDALRQQNPDIVAWVYVPGCDISFPVVQGSDNSYYLSHTTDKQESIYGSVFLDSAANSQFLDDNSIIYGHSVEGGGMFTLLKKYCDEDFFKSHPVFYLLTPDANYNCHVFTFAKTTDDSVFYTTSFGDYRQETLDSMKQSSTYFNDLGNTDQKFVSLSTCDLDYGFESSHRFVLTGQLEKTSDDIVLKD